MTWTTVDFDVALEVACHEGIVRQAYKDSVGVWTWSVGLTNATGHNVERYIGKPQPLEHCLAVYVWALDRYAEAVRRAFRGHNLTKAQFAAALSFHWNTGAIERASWVNHFKAGNMAAAKKAFMNWTKPPEITGRRRAERDLFFDGKWTNKGTMTEYTRLTANHTPVWGSAQRIDVRDAMRAAFATRGQQTAPAAPPRPDPKPNATKPMPAPDARPAPVPGGNSKAPLIGGIIIAIIAAIAAFFGLGG